VRRLDKAVGGGVKYKAGGGEVYVKRSGQRFAAFSEKRVKDYINLFLDANLFERVSPAEFDAIAAQKK